MNEVVNCLVNRRSIRKYSDKPIDQAVLNEIIQAGVFAPSGMGKQSSKLLVVTNKTVRDQLAKINAEVMKVDSDPFYGAPYVIVVLGNKNIRTYLEDGSLVLGNLLNAAYSVGVDSCWIHRAKEVMATPQGQQILEKAGISKDYVGIGNCILGYHEGEYPKAAPRVADKVVFIR